MSTTRFVLFDAIGSLVYGTFYIAAGFLFHNQLSQAMATLNRIGFSVGLFAVVLVGGYMGVKYARRRKFAIGELRRGKVHNQMADLGATNPENVVQPVQKAPSTPELNIHPLQNFPLAATSLPSEGLKLVDGGPVSVH